MNVDKKKQWHTSLCAEITLRSKKFYTVNLMMFCQITSRIFQTQKNLSCFFLATTYNPKNMIVEIFHSPLQCKGMSYRQKGSVIKNRKQILSGFWCSQVFRRHTLASLSHSSHLIHGGGGGGGGAAAFV